MNTPAHLLIGAAAFGRAGQPRITLAALLGALAPDLSLYLMAGWAIFVAGIPPEAVFRQLYFSPLWQQVFAIDNSFILWGAGFAAAAWAGRPAWRAFAGAGLLHLACDFPLHHDDARRHFWPLSDWVFESPVSYWDSRHYGTIVGGLELVLCLGLCLLLWRRFPGALARVAIAATGVMLVGSGVMWGVLLAGPGPH